MNIKDFPKITIILRGYTYEQTRNIVEILSNSKIKSIEIALKNKEDKDTVGKIIEEFGDKMLIGAGTVLNKEDLLEVIEKGVKFVLSPIMFSKEMLEICKENNVISVPAAFSPSEIYASFENGADIVKVFPASSVTSKFFNAIKAPLGDLKLMAVGGVNANNAEEYLKNGADFLGIGSGVFKNEDVVELNNKNLKKSIEAFEKIIY